jgi:hypothetical protein
MDEILVLSDKEEVDKRLIALLTVFFPDCKIRIFNNQGSEAQKNAVGGDDAKPVDKGTTV